MPQFIAMATVFLIESGVSVGVAVFAAQVFVYASTAYLINRVSAALSPRPKNSSPGSVSEGMEVSYYDSGASSRIVYGRVRTGGMETIPAQSSGANNEYLHKVLTLAGHEVDSYYGAYFDVDSIATNSIAPLAFTGSDGHLAGTKWANHAWLRLYRGTATDSADRTLIEVDSTAFGNFRGRGIAKAELTYKFNRDLWKNIPEATFVIQGKRCYDPRLDVTPGADPTNASYRAWTSNVALCAADYLMADYGGSYAAEDIDWTTVVTAANNCDALVNIPGATTQARYTFNGILMAAAKFEDNLKAIIDAMLGRLIFRDGQWRMYAGGWQAASTALDFTDFISGVSIRLEGGKRKRFNRMFCWYVDPARNWQRVQSYPRSNSTYATADFETLDVETEQLACTNEYEAQRKAEFLLRASRNQVLLTGKLPPRLQNVALWDTVGLTWGFLGWSSKTFRVVGIDINVDGSLDVALLEEQSSDWTDLAAGDYNAPSIAPLPLINPTVPTAPEGFGVTPQVNGTLLFEFNKAIIAPFGTVYQIVRSTNSADASVGTVVWEGLQTERLALVMPTADLWYWGRTRTGSLFSAYTPNTFGLYALPAAESDSTFRKRVVPDAEFTLVNSTVWKITDNSNLPFGPFSLQPTGGIGAGCVSINGTYTPGSFYDAQFAPFRGYSEGDNFTDVYPVSNGKTVKVYVRFKAESVTSTGSIGGPGVFCYARYMTGSGTVVTEFPLNFSADSSHCLDCRSVIPGVWNTNVFSFYLPNSPDKTYYEIQGPGLETVTQGMFKTGVIVVDYFDANVT